MSAVVTPITAHPSRILDVVIVGAGLCGLALARTLAARGLSLQVLEARERLGGRAHTLTCPHTGQAVDMGPTWLWPDTEPRIAALLHSLGLPTTAQHDPGDALWLTDPSQAPEQRLGAAGSIHASAQRITGGVAQLVNALAASLPAGSVRLNTPVHTLRDFGSYLEVTTPTGLPVRARQVVLAMPPRMISTHLSFEPPLPASVQAALQATPTWMAAQAKSVTTFAQPFWRAAGHSGNALVRHPQAMLAEVFDLSTLPAGALGGFVALNAAQRDQFRRSLPLLIESQLAQLYGIAAQSGHAYFMDWAEEPWTCSAADRSETPNQPAQADPCLRRPVWAGRLHLGSSETAAHGAGHMEGALEAADRLAHQLLATAAQAHWAQSVALAANDAASPADHASALAAFHTRVQALRAAAPEHYRQHLARLLAAQHHEQLTQRALLAAADLTYSAALLALDAALPALNTAASEAGAGRHPLTPTLLAAFSGWNQELIDTALAHNSSSCALSNFPQEHQPDAELRRAISLDLAAAWREFALELNTRLLQALPPAAAPAPIPVPLR